MRLRERSNRKAKLSSMYVRMREKRKKGERRRSKLERIAAEGHLAMEMLSACAHEREKKEERRNSPSHVRTREREVEEMKRNGAVAMERYREEKEKKRRR